MPISAPGVSKPRSQERRLNFTCAISCPPTSENSMSELQPHLELIEPVQRRGLASYPSEVRRSRRQLRRIHLRPVLQIDCVRAELESEALGHLELPEQVRIPLIQTVAPQAIEEARKDADVERGGLEGRVAL